MKISSIGIGLVSIALSGAQASAAETYYAAGTKAFPLQQAGGTARAAGMGSAVVGVSQGSASLLWNPAGLSRMSCSEIGIHHNSGLGDTIQEIAIFGMPLGADRGRGRGGELGGIAASFGYVNYGSFEGRDSLGLQTSNYETRDYSGSLGWGMELLPGLSGGLAVKTYHSSLADQGYDAFAGDVGILWKLLPSVDLGATYSNINLGNTIGGSQLASGWRVGGAWTVDKHLLLAAAGELQQHSLDRFQLGTEYLVGNVDNKVNVLALRAGYEFNYPDPELSGLTGFSFGLGYTITRSIALDYAMLPTGELGNSHRLSLTFKFDCPGKPKPAMAAPVLQPAPKAPIVVKAIILEDSHFDFDKATLRPEGMQALRENVQVLKDNPSTMVRVAGYTSMSGTPEYNQLLSERRAAAVEDFLITEGGIAPSRISAVGYGSTQPATYEPSPEEINSPAAKSNMRVLFEIIVK